MSFSPVHTPSKQLAVELGEIITKAGIFAPRSKQIAIGPSEIGHDCTRRLAYKLLDWEKFNESPGGNWSAQVGTAIHGYLADIFGKREGYEVERKVTIRGNLAGTVDLYDVNRGIVMDWKTTGLTGLKERRSSGPTNQQKIQVMLYCYGKKQAGYDVKQGALVYLPTSGSITDMHVELFDYDENLALAALERLDSIHSLLGSMDLEKFPQYWDLVPAESNRLCNYCPYFVPFSKDLAKGCNGDTVSREPA